MNYVHVHDILDLFAPVADAELPFFELLGDFLLLVGVLRGDVLHVFHQTLYVAHA